MATTNPTPVFSSDGPLSPHLVEYLEAMEERIVSRLLAALCSMYEAGALEQMLAKMIPVVVASVQEAMRTVISPADNNTVSLVSRDEQSPDSRKTDPHFETS